MTQEELDGIARWHLAIGRVCQDMFHVTRQMYGHDLNSDDHRWRDVADEIIAMRSRLAVACSMLGLADEDYLVRASHFGVDHYV